MQAIILATSEAEGLKPLTEAIPAAMLPVLSRPVMVGAVEQLAQQGVKNVIVSLYDMPGSIEAYFGIGQRWNLSIEYVLQREQWGSAGALKWAENLLTETFLVLPADQIFELDIKALLDWHTARQSQITTVVHPHGTGVGYNGPGVSLAPNGQVTAIRPGSDRSTFYALRSALNATAIHPGSDPSPAMEFGTGIYMCEPHVLRSIPPRTAWDISAHLLPHLLEQGTPVYGYRLPEFWHPIRSFRDYQTSHWRYLEHLEGGNQDGQRPVRPDIPLRARPVARGVWVGRNTLVHPAARLSPPVFIGENSFVGRDVELGPEAMIGSNVLVDDGATISHSTILNNTYVGQLVNVKNSIASAGLLIDVETGESTLVVDQFLLGEARTVGSESLLQRLADGILAFGLIAGVFPFGVLLGFAAWISTGKIFSRVGQVGMRTSSTPVGNEQLRRFELLRFSTRRDGKDSRLGKWLERWEFHRLPELWNVLTGDLRLIGVKSLYPDEASKMVEKWQQKRNEYYPGFTGLWYLQTHAESTLDEILITDAYYVATRTWREDVRIFWQTLPVWWKRMNRPGG